MFLLLVIINGLFKFYINTYKGRLGERMLRRIRFELVDRVLRFPPNQFKRVKSAEVATMVKDEVEPLGGFIGDAFVQPALLGGQALTAMVFIMVQNFWLGLIAAGHRRRAGRPHPAACGGGSDRARPRAPAHRARAGRTGRRDRRRHRRHPHPTTRRTTSAPTSRRRLGRIFKIRYDLYQWKFLVKFLNNFLAQVTPFLFYAIGGYLALQGRLDVGQLVAVIAAYKDLPGPIKELIDWDQQRVRTCRSNTRRLSSSSRVDRLLDPKIQTLDRWSRRPR